MVKVLRKALLEILTGALPLTTSQQVRTLPILQCVHLHCENGVLAVTAYNVDVWFMASVPARGEKFSACVEAKLLHEAVRGKVAVGEMVEVEAGVGSNTLALKIGNMDVMLPTWAVEDYPAIPNFEKDGKWKESGEWELGAWHEAAAWVSMAASADRDRPLLNGVFFTKGQMVSTDGHRIHMSAPLGCTLPTSELVPLEVVESILAATKKGTPHESINLERNNRYSRFSTGRKKFVYEISTNRFPPCEKVIPERNGNFVGIDGTKFAQMVKQVAQENKLLVSFEENSLELRSWADAKYDKSLEITDEVHKENCDWLPMVIGVNAKYLMEAVRGALVYVWFTSELTAIRVERGDGSMAFVMPMRLD